MSKFHLLDGDEYGQKLLAEIEDNTVTFVSVELDERGQLRHRSFATLPVNRIIALAEVLKNDYAARTKGS